MFKVLWLGSIGNLIFWIFLIYADNSFQDKFITYLLAVWSSCTVAFFLLWGYTFLGALFLGLDNESRNTYDYIKNL